MAHSVDPDQGAIWSGSALFACHFVRKFLQENILKVLFGSVALESSKHSH